MVIGGCNTGHPPTNVKSFLLIKVVIMVSSCKTVVRVIAHKSQLITLASCVPRWIRFFFFFFFFMFNLMFQEQTTIKFAQKSLKIQSFYCPSLPGPKGKGKGKGRSKLVTSTS